MTPFEKILTRYGSQVLIFREEGGTGNGARALLQPIRDRARRDVASPLGWGKRERWLYMGQPDVSLEVGPEGFLRWGEREFSVLSARRVDLGREKCYWWGILEPREEKV